MLDSGATTRAQDRTALVAGHGVALGGLLLGAAAVVACSVLAPGAPLQHWPWPVQAVLWLLVVAVRADPVQLLLAGGDLSRRNAARTAFGCLLMAAALTSSGLWALVPLGCTAVIAVHLQHRRATALLSGGLSLVVLTGAAVVGAATGVLATAVPPSGLVVLVLGGAGLAMATVGNHSLLAASAEASAGALAREQAARQGELEQAALHDPLTGALNRRGLVERLGPVLADPRGGVAVVFFDLDGFKAVNDTHGHDVGDELLVAVAGRLQASVRVAPRLPGASPDLVARLGGDEFVVVLADVASTEQAAALAERLSHLVAAPLSTSAGRVAFGASAGVAFSAEPLEAEELLRRADAAMYAEKRRRRARVPAPR